MHRGLDGRETPRDHAYESDVANPYFGRGVQADFAAIVPGAERFGDRSVRFASDDPLVAYRGFLAGNRLASGIG